MNATKPTRHDRFELLVRSMLGLALLVGVIWAWTGGVAPAFDFGALPG